jgi:ABC-type branched-subunit amino acid transport system ATPase component
MRLLSIRNVSKCFEGIVALDDVSFDVESGQIVGIIGPNGSGKTTLINLITGVYRPTAGDIRFRDATLVGCKPFEIARRGIGRTFQNIRLFDQLSILDNVLVGSDQHHAFGYFGSLAGTRATADREEAARQEAVRVLSRVSGNLLREKDRFAGQLSYADKRRLEIARALAMRPQLLLLDEPAAGMSPHEIRVLISDIRRIAADGVTVLLVEHKMRLIEGVTERVVVLDYGRKIAEDTFERARRNPHVIEAYLGRSYADARAQAS